MKNLRNGLQTIGKHTMNKLNNFNIIINLKVFRMV